MIPTDYYGHFLVGPTAVGKSAVAHMIAERRGVAILSADSMLVYKGMDIGTAKPSPYELSRYRYAGVDIVEPDHDFNLALYLDHARGALERSGDCELVVVGGSGLYVKALTRGLDDGGGPDDALRGAAEKILADSGVEALQKFVHQNSPENYAALKDKDNPRRLMRALERKGSAGPGSWTEIEPPRIAGLRLDRALLRERIENRVDLMHREGLLDEAERLRATGRLSRTARQAIGYREAMEVLDGDMSWDEAREKICIRTARLAKSQMTWFNNQERVEWVDVDEYDGPTAVAARVEEIWRQNGRTRIRL